MMNSIKQCGQCGLRTIGVRVYIANWTPVALPCAGWSRATLNRFIGLRCLSQTPTNQFVVASVYTLTGT